MGDGLYKRAIRYLTKASAQNAERLNKKLDIMVNMEDDFKDELVTLALVNDVYDGKELKEILEIKIRNFKEHQKTGLGGEYGKDVQKNLENELKKYESMLSWSSVI